MKIKLVILVLVALVAVAGSFYYLGNRNSGTASNIVSNVASNTSSVTVPPVAATNPNVMTREKAAGLIQSYIKQNYPMDWMGTTGGAIDGQGFTCPSKYGSSASGAVASNLVSQGYFTETTDADNNEIFTATAKTSPYVISAATGVTNVLLATITNVTVTGISNTVQSNAVQVDFTATFKLTPFGAACSYPTSQSSFAILQSFDDGWRVAAVN